MCNWKSVNKWSTCWYCSDISKSTILCKAIESLLTNNTVEKHFINFLSKEGWAHSSPIQFMGFLTANSHDNYLTSFSLKSFCLFFMVSSVDDGTGPDDKYTIVACLITERSYSCTNMQEHLLQNVQILQKNRGAEWRIVLTTEYLGMDFLVDKVSNEAFKSIGFSCIMGTDDVQSKYVAVALEIVPTIPYSDLILGGKVWERLLPV
jgi:hypothetical protein